MLMDHPQSEAPGIPRTAEPLSRSADADLPAIGLNEPERDAHQGGLPGAVLSEERVQFSFGQNEIGPAQRVHGAESLIDVPEFEGGGHG
jgi:hypothetical protein